jgi:hypothetical protein
MTATSPGQQFAGWRVVRVETPLGKRALVSCVACGRTQQVSVESFLDTSLKRCECSRRPGARVRTAESFAADIAGLEAFTSGKERRR